MIPTETAECLGDGAFKSLADNCLWGRLGAEFKERGCYHQERWHGLPFLSATPVSQVPSLASRGSLCWKTFEGCMRISAANFMIWDKDR